MTALDAALVALGFLLALSFVAGVSVFAVAMKYEWQFRRRRKRRPGLLPTPVRPSPMVGETTWDWPSRDQDAA